MGFRKGANVDEELWPAESFGGVSDEQFWDDLASDKPLTTTARTAQPDSATRNRPLDAMQPSAAKPPVAKPPVAKPPVAKPPAALPSVATQPVQSLKSQVPSGTQPARVPTGPSPLTSAPSHLTSAPSHLTSAPSHLTSAPSHLTSAPSHLTSAPSHLTSAPSHLTSASQPMSAPPQPAETHGRRRASRSDDEDPLTSAAFSLRSSGPVDGRSSRRSRDMTRDQYDAAVAQETQKFSAAETEAANSGYPGGVPPFRRSEPAASGRSVSSYSGTAYGDPSSVTQAMNTPPYGENYEYGSGGSQAQPDDLRRPNGTRSHARHSGTGEATRATRQAHPQDVYQGSGTYPAGGYQDTGSHQTGGYPTGGYLTGGYPDGGHQGNGHHTGAHPTGAYPTTAYQGNAQQANASAYRGNGGHRAPYDPREDYRRLTHLG